MGSLGFPCQVGLTLSRPGEGGWDPLAPPVGGRLKQDLPPALGSLSPWVPSRGRWLEPRLSFPLHFLP